MTMLLYSVQPFLCIRVCVLWLVAVYDVGSWPFRSLGLARCGPWVRLPWGMPWPRGGRWDLGQVPWPSGLGRAQLILGSGPGSLAFGSGLGPDPSQRQLWVLRGIYSLLHPFLHVRLGAFVGVLSRASNPSLDVVLIISDLHCYSNRTWASVLWCMSCPKLSLCPGFRRRSKLL